MPAGSKPTSTDTSQVRQLMARARHAAIATDGRGRIRFWNPAAIRLLGNASSSETLLQAGRSFHQALQSRDVFGNRLSHRGSPLQAMLEAGEAIQSFEIDATKADGSTIRLGISIIVVVEDEECSFIHLLQERKRRRRSDELIDRLVAQAQEDPEWGELDLSSRPSATDNPHRQPDPQLTPRQRQVLRLLADGRSTEQIAEDLHISVHTVRRHCQNLMRKMNIHSKVEAVALALRRRLI